VGGLSHYIEAEGIATTQISLIREHTVTIRPPRALWVSFPLGRPLGTPNQPEFQRDVLKHALRLLEYSPPGPVLEDYPHDAAGDDIEAGALACPVSFGTIPQAATSRDALMQEFQDEVDNMKTWYDIAREKSLRATAGISGLGPDQIAALFRDFIENKIAGPELHGEKLSDLLRLAAEDLKAYYFAAISAQPGQSTNAATLSDWFWGETCAARVLNEVRKCCLNIAAKDMQLAGKLLLIPRSQMHRFEE